MDTPIRFADRAHRHMFNGGALTPENGATQWAQRADGIRKALKAESARWGDFRGEPPRTLVQWQNALDREYEQWFPFRNPVTIGQLRSRGLYPDIDPPVFNRHGGQVAQGFALTLISNDGNVYFTTDGSDPRLPGGAVNPAAQVVPGAIIESTVLEAASPGWRFLDDGTDLGTTWVTPQFNDSEWATGTAPLGFGIINGHPFGGAPINPDRHLTVYFRRQINITNSESIIEASARIMSDGGAVLYINGNEVARDNMPAGQINFNTRAIDDSSGVSPQVVIVAVLRVDSSVSFPTLIATSRFQ